jgi:hypothetical protein
MKKFAIVVAVLMVIGLTDEYTHKDKYDSAKQSEVVSAVDTEETIPVNTEDQTLTDWYNTDGSDLFNNLASHQKDISIAADNADMPTLKTACANLNKFIESVKDEQIPNESMQSYWHNALYHYRLGANFCVEGVRDNDPDKLSSSAEEARQGTNYITDIQNYVRSH